MNLIRKIKSYFVKHEWHSWKDFHWDNYDLKFKSLDEETLLDIGNYIKHNLKESQQIGNNRHRLRENSGIECKSLNELLPLLKEIIIADYSETASESLVYNWDFRYFISPHILCENTICISNGLRAKDGSTGNCIYPVASVRKFDDRYFCWNHLA
ncbi:MAG TPA: hypothetical protein VF581_04060 [Flavobacterium sp.]|jgi:hypothetical protein